MECPFCKGNYKNDASLRKHKSIVHGENSIKKCANCSREFGSNNFAKHVKICSRIRIQLAEEFQEMVIPQVLVPEIREKGSVLAKEQTHSETKIRDCSVVIKKLPGTFNLQKTNVREHMGSSKTLDEQFDELLNIQHGTSKLRERRAVQISLEEQFRIVSQEQNRFEIVEIPGKGKGVLAKQNFLYGDWIFEYKGVLLNHKEALIKEDQYSGNDSIGSYMFYFRSGKMSLCLDATIDIGNVCRMVNHSRKNPNLKPKVFLDQACLDRPRVIFIACKNIKIGDELQYDYGDRSAASLTDHPWLKF